MKLSKKIKLYSILPAIGTLSTVAISCAPPSAYVASFAALSKENQIAFKKQYKEFMKDAKLEELFDIKGNSKCTYITPKPKTENGRTTYPLNDFLDKNKYVMLNINIERADKTSNKVSRRDYTIKNGDYKALDHAQFSNGDKVIYSFGYVDKTYNQLGKVGDDYNKTFVISNEKDAEGDVKSFLGKVHLLDATDPNKSLLDEEIIFNKEGVLTHVSSIMTDVSTLIEDYKDYKETIIKGVYKEDFKYETKYIFQDLENMYLDGHGDDWENLLCNFLDKCDSLDKITNLLKMFNISDSTQTKVKGILSKMTGGEYSKFKDLISYSKAMIRDVDWQAMFANAKTLELEGGNMISYIMYFVPMAFHITIDTKALLEALNPLLDSLNDIAFAKEGDVNGVKKSFETLENVIVNRMHNFRIWVKKDKIEDFMKNMNDIASKFITPDVFISLVKGFLPASITKTLNEIGKKDIGLGSPLSSILSQLIITPAAKRLKVQEYSNKNPSLTEDILYLLYIFMIGSPFNKENYTDEEFVETGAKWDPVEFSVAYLHKSIGGFLRTLHDKVLADPALGKLVRGKIKTMLESAGIKNIKTFVLDLINKYISL